MLALAYAAAHPGCVASLVLIGCGSFDPASRERMRAICDERTDPALRQRLERVPQEVSDPDDRLRVRADLLLRPYSHDLVVSHLEAEVCDACAHRETWEDMMRLQREGVYPAAFAAIKAPVLMLHGAVDPHPGPMIRASLMPFLPQLEYQEWAPCGHYPWLEKAVREEFVATLRTWLLRHGMAHR
jgi:pimeloyl-ACP methyl ester carboxylesterase